MSMVDPCIENKTTTNPEPTPEPTPTPTPEPTVHDRLNAMTIGERQACFKRHLAAVNTRINGLRPMDTANVRTTIYDSVVLLESLCKHFALGEVTRTGFRKKLVAAATKLLVKDPEHLVDQGLDVGATRVPSEADLQITETSDDDTIDPSSTDEALGDRLANDHRDTICFVIGIGWRKYVDGIWGDGNRDDMRLIRACGRESAARMDSEIDAANRSGNEGLAKSLMKTQVKLRTATHLKHAIEMAATVKSLEVSADSFDTDPYIIGLNNGIYDLRTGAFSPHDPSNRITLKTSFDYDPTAVAPTYEKMLHSNHPGDPETVEYLLRFYGYCLSGLVTEQVWHMAIGDGGNGKNVETDVLLNLLGNYSTKLNADDLMTMRGGESKSRERVNVSLRGRRFAAVSEGEESARLNNSLMKELSGGDRLRGRLLYREAVDFAPTHKIMFLTNHLPTITSTDSGTWRRPRIVPYPKNWMVDPNRDPNLADKLAAELPGIFNLLAAAFRRYLDAGVDGLTPSPAIVAATEQFKTDNDPLGEFVTDKFVLTDDLGDKIDQKLLYTMDYLPWLAGQGIDERYRMRNKTFYAYFVHRGCEQHKIGNTRFMCGIRPRFGK